MLQKNMRCGTCALVTYIDCTLLLPVLMPQLQHFTWRTWATLEPSWACQSGGPNGAYTRDAFSFFRITRDHKPSVPEEMERIKNLGGKVTNSGGVYRVQGTLRGRSASECQGEIAVCRALGDAHMKPYITDIP